MKYYIILCLLVFLSSCSNDFLDKQPLDAISSDNYWQTSKDLELYVNQFYTLFPFETRNDKNLLDGSSDNLIEDGFSSLLAGTRIVPGAGGPWTSHYTTVRSLNYFFDKYTAVPEAFDTYKQYVGEAHFFRAYVYFNLVQDYGDVPWVNKVLKDDSDELKLERTPRNVVVDSILSDLDKAIIYLGERGSVPDQRLNKNIALLLKSRVSLFEGTWEKYHANTPFGVNGSNGTKYLELARAAAKQIMDTGSYDIYSTNSPNIDYYRLFGQNDYSSNPEIMFWKKWDANLGLVRWTPSVWGNAMGVTKEFVDSYLAKDGNPISISNLYKGDENLMTVIQDRDPRLAQTIWIPGDPKNVIGATDTTFFERADIHLTGSYLNVTGYQLKKYSNAWGDNLRQNYYQCEIGSIIFRYAEVLLNYIEAKAELGDLTQEDIDLTINKLRARVNMPPLVLNAIPEDLNWNFPALSPIINEIRRERRVEMSFEGLRKYDLLRWRAHNLFVKKRSLGATFVQSDYPEMEIGKNVYINSQGYIDPYQAALPEGYSFNPERDYLAPLPNIELTLNENYKQNSGW